MKNKKIFGLNINIILLGIVSFFNDISSEMIAPILPILIKSLGGTGFTIGLIGGLRDSIGSILKLLSGYLSDKAKKRKCFIFTGYLTSSIFKTLLGFSRNWQHLLIISSLERVGKGIREAPRDAIISMYSKKRGFALGFHKALDTLGAINGSILTLLLYWFLKLDLKVIIFIAAAISFVSLIPLSFVKDKKQKTEIIKLGNEKISKKLTLFILISGFFSLSNFSYMFFILKAQSHFINEYKVVIPILLYVLFNIFYSLFAIPIGIISDKIGRKKIIFSTYLLFTFICLGFAYAQKISSFIFLFIIYGIFYAALDSNHKAYVADMSDENIRATALGFFHTVSGIVLLFSSLIAGFLWETISSSAVFIYAATVSFIALILFLFYYKKL